MLPSVTGIRCIKLKPQQVWSRPGLASLGDRRRKSVFTCQRLNVSTPREMTFSAVTWRFSFFSSTFKVFYFDPLSLLTLNPPEECRDGLFSRNNHFRKSAIKDNMWCIQQTDIGNVTLSCSVWAESVFFCMSNTVCQTSPKSFLRQVKLSWVIVS